MRQTQTARIAGLLYLCIILCGIGAEAGLRLPYHSDPELLASNPGPLRLSVLLDSLMVLADVGLAICLFTLLRRYGEGLALAAMSFRLVQAAAILAGLGWLVAALELPQLAPGFFATHTMGYDLSLLAFAMNCLLTGLLLRRAAVPYLGWLLIGSGAVYALGTTVSLIGPDPAPDGVAFAYLLPLFTELAVCVWLLMGARQITRAGA